MDCEAADRSTLVCCFLPLEEEMMNANATVTESSQYLTSPQTASAGTIARSAAQISSWALSSATSVGAGCLDRTYPA